MCGTGTLVAVVDTISLHITSLHTASLVRVSTIAAWDHAPSEESGIRIHVDHHLICTTYQS